MSNSHLSSPATPSEMPWWKMLGICLLAFEGIAVLIGFIPPYSKVALIIGLILATIGAVGATIRVITKNIWIWIATANAGILLFFLLGARFMLNSLSNNWIWLLPFGAGYILAWLIPLINPRLSALLWREQIAPETRLGRGVLKVSVSLLPIAGAAGAFLGMYASRYGMMRDLNIIFGPLLMLAAIGWGQAAAHQLWQKMHRLDESQRKGSDSTA